MTVSEKSADQLVSHYIDNINSVYKMLSFNKKDYPNPSDFLESVRANAESSRTVMEDNEKLLSENVYPYLRDPLLVDEASFERLNKFSARLLALQETADIGLTYEICEAILPYAEKSGNLARQLPLYHRLGVASYYLSWQSHSFGIRKFEKNSNSYFKKAAGYLKDYDQITDPALRDIIIRCVANQALDYNLRNFDEAKESLVKIKEIFATFAELRKKDPKVVDWEMFFATIHRYRLSTISSLRDGLELPKADLRDLVESAQICHRYAQDEAKETGKPVDPLSSYYYYASLWHAGMLSDRELLDGFLSTIGSCKMDDDSRAGIDAHITVPTRLTFYLDKMGFLSQNEKDIQLTQLYELVLNYTIGFRNIAQKNYYTKQLADCLAAFKEVPGDYSVADLIMLVMFAQHVPTYVHSNVVSRLVVFLTEQLLAADSDAFDTARNYLKLMDNQQLIDYARTAALLHDTGKISCFDYVSNNTRNLFPEEFQLLRDHPYIGSAVLQQHKTTAIYADIALGHQRWYNGQGGYPESFDNTASPVKIFIDLTTIADSLDAATDLIGRNYKPVKTFEEVITEFSAQKGTHYNPEVVDLISREPIRAKLKDYLLEARKESYDYAYDFLL